MGLPIRLRSPHLSEIYRMPRLWPNIQQTLYPDCEAAQVGMDSHTMRFLASRRFGDILGGAENPAGAYYQQVK